MPVVPANEDIHPQGSEEIFGKERLQLCEKDGFCDLSF